MIRRPDDIRPFRVRGVVRPAGGAAARGCSPRVEPSGKIAVTAQHEVAERKVQQATTDTPA